MDRNYRSGYFRFPRLESLSARRAWIEISSLDDILAGVNEVALRKESVDRNAEDWLNAGRLPRGRSPQGERG